MPGLNRCISQSSPPERSGGPATAGREPVRKWAVSTQTCNATCWGWLVPDKIVEMTIGKLSYGFCRSLPSNDRIKVRPGQ